jgi:hypothetical protein
MEMDVSSAMGPRTSRESSSPLSSSEASAEGDQIDSIATNSRVGQASQSEGKSFNNPDAEQQDNPTTPNSQTPGSLVDGRSRLVDMSA